MGDKMAEGSGSTPSAPVPGGGATGGLGVTLGLRQVPNLEPQHVALPSTGSSGSSGMPTIPENPTMVACGSGCAGHE